jgi:nitroreductase
METAISTPTNIPTETIRVIYERRAVRKYRNKPVEKDLIERVIDAGRMAPSAINRQPWKFYVLTDKPVIRSFANEIAAKALTGFASSGVKNIIKTATHLLHFSHGFDFHALEDPVFHGAPVVIFITGTRDNEWAPIDIGMCAQNMMLAAKSIGLDSCPVGFARFVDKTKSFPRLKVPDTEQVFLAVILGYGDENPEIHERKKDNVIFIH